MAAVTTTRGTAVLTGGTGVIGAAIAKGLVSSGLLNLVLLARNQSKAEKLVKSMGLSEDSAEVEIVKTDLNSIESVNSAIKSITDKHDSVDVLVNCAALVNDSFVTTEDGLEEMFQINVLSYIQLTEGLLPSMQKCAETGDSPVKFPRIVHVASNYSSAALPRDLSDFSKVESSFRTENQKFRIKRVLFCGYFCIDWEFTHTQGTSAMKRRFNGNNVYQQTKRANRMISAYYAQLFRHRKLVIGSFSCHPGVVGSGVLSGLGFGSGFDTPEQCAITTLHLALSDSVTLEQSGMYFNRDRRDKVVFSECSRSSDVRANQALFDHCTSILGSSSSSSD